MVCTDVVLHPDQVQFLNICTELSLFTLVFALFLQAAYSLRAEMRECTSKP